MDLGAAVKQVTETGKKRDRTEYHREFARKKRALEKAARESAEAGAE